MPREKQTSRSLSGEETFTGEFSKSMFAPPLAANALESFHAQSKTTAVHLPTSHRNTKMQKLVLKHTAHAVLYERSRHRLKARKGCPATTHCKRSHAVPREHCTLIGHSKDTEKTTETRLERLHQPRRLTTEKW
jgi:hypothetical protein